MLEQATSKDLHSAISLQELVAGAMLSDSQDGMTLDLFGQDHVHASRSVLQDVDMEPMTNVTSGPSGLSLSKSAILRQSLVSKLKQRFDTDGSTLFKMTWSQKATPSHRQFFRLAARARHTFDKGFGSLPTPNGTSNHGKNHVAGRLDEWGGSSNPWRGTDIGKVHCPAFELWVMSYPEAWAQLMPPGMPSSRKSRQK
jgi:hypothetical protein